MWNEFQPDEHLQHLDRLGLDDGYSDEDDEENHLRQDGVIPDENGLVPRRRQTDKKTICRVIIGMAIAIGAICAVAVVISQQGSKGGKVITVQKSPNDARLYRVIVLPNNLQAMLISDVDTDKAAASLDVRVGSQSDPPDIPGLAHFLEHMLFMGTEKYPLENEYSNFLSEHGGYSNAYTADEDTNYFFEVHSDFLEGALDRFAQFFIAPLFTESGTEREMNAVNSEHSKNIQHDGWRADQLWRSTSNPAHPFSHFGTGNLTTLNEVPKAKGINVRDKLLEFHAREYSANRMKLAVLGKESLDDLESWVRQMFAGVKNSNRPPRDFSKEGSIRTPEQKGMFYSVKPVSEIRTVDISWVLPPVTQHFRIKPLRSLAALIGHEGEGSILSYLKARHWAEGLTAGAQEEQSAFCIMSVTVSLTEPGLDHVNEVIAVIFDYIRLLQKEKVPQWFWEENAAVANMTFRFLEKQEPSGFVSWMTSALQMTPPSLVLKSRFMYENFDAELIHSYLARMTPADSIIFLTAKEDKTMERNLNEYWYGTQYGAKNLPKDILDLWQTNRTSPELHLPVPNVFITTNFTILTPGSRQPVRAQPLTYASIALDEPGIRVWHKQDDLYYSPKVNVLLDCVAPATKPTPTSVLYSKVFVELLQESLREYSYQGGMAGYSYGISASAVGITLELRGYSEKIKTWVDKIIDAIGSFKVDEERLPFVLEELSRGYRNFKESAAYAQGGAYLSLILREDGFTNSQMLEVFEDASLLTPALIQAHVDALKAKLWVEALVHGNVDTQNAIALAKTLTDRLGSSPVPPSERPVSRARNFEGVSTGYLMQGLNPDDKNSAIFSAFDCGATTIHSEVVMDVMASVLVEPLFRQLRTIEQLGYIVWSRGGTMLGRDLYQVVIQSDVQDPVYLDTRVRSALMGLNATVFNLSSSDLDGHVQAKIAELTAPFNSMSEETAFLWSRITSRKYDFDRSKKLVNELRSLKSSELAALFERCLLTDVKNQLAVLIFGGGDPPRPLPPASSTWTNAAGASLQRISPNQAGLAQWRAAHTQFHPPTFDWGKLPSGPVLGESGK